MYGNKRLNSIEVSNDKSYPDLYVAQPNLENIIITSMIKQIEALERQK